MFTIVIMNKSLKIKLLEHEKQLLEQGLIKNVTYIGENSIHLYAKSSIAGNDYVNVYRVMGDIELQFLLNNKILPNTQPYQAIVEGEIGRKYMEKYLNGLKYVNSKPTTVVEFTIKKYLYDQMFKIQYKAEDGVLSIGLGNKVCNCLNLFNASIKSFSIVTVKRK